METLIGNQNPLSDSVSTDAHMLVGDPSQIHTDTNVVAEQDLTQEQIKVQELQTAVQYGLDQERVLRNEKHINLRLVMEHLLANHLNFWLHATEKFKEMQSLLELLGAKQEGSSQKLSVS